MRTIYLLSFLIDILFNDVGVTDENGKKNAEMPPPYPIKFGSKY